MINASTKRTSQPVNGFGCCIAYIQVWLCICQENRGGRQPERPPLFSRLLWQVIVSIVRGRFFDFRDGP